MVNKYIYLYCGCKSPDFARLHDRETVAFRNSAPDYQSEVKAVVPLDDSILPFAIVGPPVMQLVPIYHQGGSTKMTGGFIKQICGPYKTKLWSYINDGPNCVI